MEGTFEVYVEDNVNEVEVTLHYYLSGGFRAARIMGPPENCYPAESPEVEITHVTVQEFGRNYPIELSEVAELSECTEDDLNQETYEHAIDVMRDEAEYAAEAAAEASYYDDGCEEY